MPLISMMYHYLCHQERKKRCQEVQGKLLCVRCIPVSETENVNENAHLEQ